MTLPAVTLVMFTVIVVFLPTTTTGVAFTVKSVVISSIGKFFIAIEYE